jgi:hypothetical protein
MMIQAKAKNLFEDLKDGRPLLQAVVGIHSLKNVVVFTMLKCLERLLVVISK